MAQGRKALCTDILQRSHKIAADLLKIDEDKEALREEIRETGEGFTEEIAELGTVEGKPGCAASTEGVVYVLNQAAFLALSEARRKKMIGDGLVDEELLKRPARKPSVTVRL